MKKILFFFLFLALCFIPKTVFAFDVIKPTSNFYVNDYANILSQETENYIIKHSVSLATQTKAQIVVVTVPNLDGASLEEYATKLFREFGIGDSKENNGLLLLLALDERQMRVEVGYGLEGILPDGKTGRLQDDYMIPYFKEDNFDEGMLNGYKAFFQEIASYYDFNGTIDAPTEEEVDMTTNVILGIVMLIFQFGFWALLIYLIIRSNKNGRGGSGGIYFNNGSSFRSSSFRSSSGGFSGGGGRSGGGGSSRGF